MRARESRLRRPKLRTVGRTSTSPRTRRVLKNRQVNSGSFIPYTISPMQHLQVVIVRSSRLLHFRFGEQESEPHSRTQMSDRPTHSPHTFFFVTHLFYFPLGLKTLGTWVRNLAHLLCSSIYTNIIQHISSKKRKG